jgi:hypothetical protein
LITTYENGETSQPLHFYLSIQCAVIKKNSVNPSNNFVILST